MAWYSKAWSLSLNYNLPIVARRVSNPSQVYLLIERDGKFAWFNLYDGRWNSAGFDTASEAVECYRNSSAGKGFQIFNVELSYTEL